FIKESAIHQGRSNVPAIPDIVIQKLLAYDWPGNIRELKNTLERMIILTTGENVEDTFLPPVILMSNKADAAKGGRLKTLEEMEKDHIVDVLEAEQNLEKAAEILGITSVTLWRKRKQYGIP
ncbi:MAG: helix-turn-helix domain-containing protein, partial [Dissulfurispiraceae bacterium]